MPLVAYVFNLSGVPVISIVVGSGFAFIKMAQQVKSNSLVAELHTQNDMTKDTSTVHEKVAF